jgi:RimJ/RimL family protein N-acetyltransferase
MKFTFAKLNISHLALLHNWLNQPHVAERWDGTMTLDNVFEEYFPSADSEDRWIVSLDSRPIAYIQRYWTENAETGWWEDQRDSGTCGIDFFIGESTLLNQGVGSAMIIRLVQMLFEEDRLKKIISDPSPQNPRSIRCLEKARFQRAGAIVTPDGPAVLMEIYKSNYIKS